jgi:hypothetical protein
MSDLRQELHQLLDTLPDQSLEHAKAALSYCANPEQHRMNIENAKRHLMRRSRQRLQEHAESTGRSFVSGIGSGGGMTHVEGNYHSSMVAFEKGKDATVHFYVFQGVPFEITETLEISDDGQKLIRHERIVSNDGTEQMLTAELPVSRSNK